MRAGKQGVAERGAWRPDARASWGLAAGAALLVMAGFAELFSSAASMRLLQPTASMPERLVFAAPPSPRSLIRRHAPALSTPLPVPVPDRVWPPIPPPVSAPSSFTPQDYLQEREREGAAALREKVTGKDLQRDLGRIKETPALQDNQGFRTANGDRVMRDGDDCAQIHTVQGSSSPTNKIDLVEPTGCPGTSDQDMNKALRDWAEKHSPPPPPSDTASP